MGMLNVVHVCVVFWGGREGYQTLLNTDVKRELDHMATFFRMAVAYKQKIGFSGQLLIEPKPKEPMKHQYDYGWLRTQCTVYSMADFTVIFHFMQMHRL